MIDQYHPVVKRSIRILEFKSIEMTTLSDDRLFSADHDAYIWILEQADTTRALRRVQTSRCHCAEQRWRLVTARRRGRRAISDKPIQAGDLVYRPDAAGARCQFDCDNSQIGVALVGSCGCLSSAKAASAPKSPPQPGCALPLIQRRAILQVRTGNARTGRQTARG
ncbi:hypothetical protein [Paraburkholderia sediminicola]|uniref:hypothetical protein n=1 Tax=Paraburkholderia sediminicola TaxID=458836 RepID=UPI0038B77D11